MKKLSVLGITLLLSGCFGGFSPQSTFYTLKQSDLKAISQKNRQIVVENVRIPSVIDKPQIVTMAPSGIVLEFSETNRWAESFSLLIQNALADNLSALLPKSTVQTTSGYERPNIRVFVQVTRFAAVFNQALSMDVRWRLVGENNATLYQTETHLSAPLGESYDDLVMKQSELVGELAQQIAKKIAN